MNSLGNVGQSGRASPNTELDTIYCGEDNEHQGRNQTHCSHSRGPRVTEPIDNLG